MRRIYIHQLKEWPNFTWQHESLAQPLAVARHKQGRLLGKLEGLGFQLREDASFQTITADVIKSSEIEGEKLPMDQVRSSIARKLGLDFVSKVKIDRHVDGVVEMMLDATQNFNRSLTTERLFGWHAAMFPLGRSGMHQIDIGTYRKKSSDPMQVVSGALGKERVHFEAPEAYRLRGEMKSFLQWFNHFQNIDPVVKAAVAHLWFVTIHPFDDGNGRMARAIADMQLSRADNSKQRFYSMSSQIQKERNDYYDFLEKTQKGSLDITHWLLWFLKCLDAAISSSEENLSSVLGKAKFWEKHQQTKFNDRQRKMLNKLMDGLDGNLTSSKWAKMTKCSHDTALRDIQNLIDLHVLEQEEGGGRSTSYRLRNLK